MTAPQPADDSPATLSEHARNLWRSVVRPATTPARRAAIESALRNLDTASAAAEIVAREGLVVVNKDSGVPHVHPAAKIEKDARAAFHREWRALGLAAKVIGEQLS